MLANILEHTVFGMIVSRQFHGFPKDSFISTIALFTSKLLLLIHYHDPIKLGAVLLFGEKISRDIESEWRSHLTSSVLNFFRDSDAVSHRAFYRA